MSGRIAVPGRAVLPPIPRIAAAILPVVLAAATGSLSTSPNIEGWYDTLRKPAFNPPNWVFPITWTILYTMIAASLWRLLGARPVAGPTGRAWWLALAAFFTQLALNAAWSPVFFAAHALGAGLVVALAMLVMVLWTIRLSWRFDRAAALLLVPYAGWVAFASLLNGVIWQMN
ncbi:TspO/MBR family protein [Methylobacterium gnaphalii]|uniref:Sensory protein TspO n=1 Tax=Methylobacterium gnaphalii TaxID=1010610 RepID=A0A512JIF7_9HYPH|nr:TspO/MBR family protein [Methylobacterium gnaphalii]GEP09703.1 sensory protein TspO [Methylobacterium gnaphalii]GJD67712.1 Tryptophan-rich protein TspO [Methylobacterium gnaphalii]GLS50121.1 sensory protein TspO [Methylobacterium gnaphalii]